MKILLRSALRAGAMLLPITAWATGPEGDEDSKQVDRLTPAVNERYLGSMMWGQTFHAAPRSAAASLRLAC